ncbi:MAG: phosphatidate cytidylyltransferase [Pirellulales bacterium]
MLRWRLLLGAIFVSVLIGLFILDGRFPGYFLFPLALLLAVLAAQEMLRLTTVEMAAGIVDADAEPSSRSLTTRPNHWVVYAGSLLVVGANGGPLLWSGYPADCPVGKLGWPMAALGVAVLLAFVGEFLRYQRPHGATINIGLTMLSIVYVGLISFLVQLRGLPDFEWGAVALVSLLITVKMCDVGAYAIGRLIGRHKMAPKLSPAKTWEGFCGGIAFACLGAWFSFAVLAPRMVSAAPPLDSSALAGVLMYGVLIGVAGVLGDLAESLLKRSAGVKDSSAWMPGFGGVLDLLDSVLFAAPVAYICWVLGFVGP